MQRFLHPVALALAAAALAVSGARLVPRRVLAVEGQVREVASLLAAAAPGGLGILDVHASQPTVGYTPYYGTSTLRLTVQLATTGTLALRVRGGATTRDTLLNGGASLTAGRVYSLSAGIRQSTGSGTALTYDYLLGTDGALDVFQLEEVFGPFPSPSPAQGTAGGGGGSVSVTGDVVVVGTDADGASATGDPVAVAGVTSSGLVLRARAGPLGRLVTTPSLSFLDESVTRIPATTSDGTNTVTLVSATAGQVVYPTTLVLTNTHASTTHTVTLLSGSGAGAELLTVRLGSGAGFVLDGRGDVRTEVSQALVMRLAAAGADVVASGAAVKR